MRTTLVLDDGIYEAARKKAFEERRSLGDVVSEWAAQGQHATAAGSPKRRLGMFSERIWVADDFDETPDEWVAALEEPLGKE